MRNLILKKQEHAMEKIEHLGKITLPRKHKIISQDDMYIRIFGEATILLHGNQGSGYSFAC